jgi:hypothetical protein
MTTVDLRTLLQFSSLFAGRRDAYFLSKEKGGSAVWEPVSLQLFRRHLMGEVEIGTYPVLDNSLCKWGCIDVDNENESDAWEQATDLWAVWRYWDVPSWIERSRSKGYHVWVFPDEWLPSSVMRNAGLYINSIAGEPSKEVNPKNDSPWRLRTGLVNTVRTPYSGSANEGRMIVVNPEDKEDSYSLRYFTERASSQRTPVRKLYALATQQQKAQRRKAYVSPWQDGTATRSYSETQQDAARILTGSRSVGPGERDQQFWTMANLLHRSGEEYGSALQRVSKAWHEQVTDQRDFPLDTALEKVRRVYGRR